MTTHEEEIPPGPSEITARWTFVLTQRQSDLLDRVVKHEVDGYNDLDDIMDLLHGWHRRPAVTETQPAWVRACHCGRTFAQCEADPCDRRAQDYDAAGREARCRGCGGWVDYEHLDPEGFGPDCYAQDEASRCG